MDDRFTAASLLLTGLTSSAVTSWAFVAQLLSPRSSKKFSLLLFLSHSPGIAQKTDRKSYLGLRPLCFGAEGTGVLLLARPLFLLWTCPWTLEWRAGGVKNTRKWVRQRSWWHFQQNLRHSWPEPDFFKIIFPLHWLMLSKSRTCPQKSPCLNCLHPKKKCHFSFCFSGKNNFRLKPVALDDNKPSSQPHLARI